MSSNAVSSCCGRPVRRAEDRAVPRAAEAHRPPADAVPRRGRGRVRRAARGAPGRARRAPVHRPHRSQPRRAPRAREPAPRDRAHPGSRQLPRLPDLPANVHRRGQCHRPRVARRGRPARPPRARLPADRPSALVRFLAATVSATGRPAASAGAVRRCAGGQERAAPPSSRPAQESRTATWRCSSARPARPARTGAWPPRCGCRRCRGPTVPLRSPSPTPGWLAAAGPAAIGLPVATGLVDLPAGPPADRHSSRPRRSGRAPHGGRCASTGKSTVWRPTPYSPPAGTPLDAAVPCRSTSAAVRSPRWPRSRTSPRAWTVRTRTPSGA